MPVTIDISGPHGNAFALMGFVRNYGRQLKWSREKIEEVIQEMMSGDYEHLVATFNKAFEGLVVAKHSRDPNEDDEDDDYYAPGGGYYSAGDDKEDEE